MICLEPFCRLCFLGPPISVPVARISAKVLSCAGAAFFLMMKQGKVVAPGIQRGWEKGPSSGSPPGFSTQGRQPAIRRVKMDSWESECCYICQTTKSDGKRRPNYCFSDRWDGSGNWWKPCCWSVKPYTIGAAIFSHQHERNLR